MNASGPESGSASCPVGRPTVGQLLRRRREALGLTLAAVAQRIDATRSYLSMIENGKVAGPPSTTMLDRLEKALGIDDRALHRAAAWQSTPESVRRELLAAAQDADRGRELAGWLRQAAGAGRSLDALLASGELRHVVDRTLGKDSDAADRTASPAPLHQARRVPLINKVAAGYPSDFTDLDYPARVADDYVTAPDIDDPDAFAATVCGDSMLPQYKAGDVIIFAPAAEVTDGCDCFVRLEPDHQSTFKRVYFDAEAGTVRLQPLNPAFPPTVLPREQVAGLYRAVARYCRI